MKLAISTGFCHTLPYKETLQIISASGCQNIELLLNKAFRGQTDEDIIAAIKANQLNVTSIHVFPRVWCEDIHDDESESISRALDKLQPALQSQLIVSHLIITRANGTVCCNDEAHKQHIRHFNRTQSVPVSTENMPPLTNGLHSFLNDSRQTLEFLQSNNLPLTFDTTHAAFYNTDLITSFELFRPYIRNIHISDFRAGKSHLLPGQGMLPLRNFLRHLKCRNYDGLLTIEPDFAGQSQVLCPKKMVALLRQALEYVNKELS